MKQMIDDLDLIDDVDDMSEEDFFDDLEEDFDNEEDYTQLQEEVLKKFSVKEREKKRDFKTKPLEDSGSIIYPLIKIKGMWSISVSSVDVASLVEGIYFKESSINNEVVITLAFENEETGELNIYAYIPKRLLSEKRSLLGSLGDIDVIINQDDEFSFEGLEGLDMLINL